MWTLARGKPARLTVTLLHGVVLAQSAFEHSANYQRSSRLVASSRSMTLTNDSHPDRIMGSQPSASRPCHVGGFSHLSAGSQPRLRLVPLTLQPPAITDRSVRRKPDNLYSRRRQIFGVRLQSRYGALWPVITLRYRSAESSAEWFCPDLAAMRQQRCGGAGWRPLHTEPPGAGVVAAKSPGLWRPCGQRGYRPAGRRRADEVRR